MVSFVDVLPSAQTAEWLCEVLSYFFELKQVKHNSFLPS